MLREAEIPLSFFEPVAHAPDGENELWGIRVVFDFLAQPAHMNVYGARVDHSIITPHAHQQAVSREDHPAVANEVHEQIKEKRGVEINRLITPAHRSPGDIDAQIINHEHLLLLLVNLSLRRRFDQLLLACPQEGTRTNAQKRSHPCVQLLPIRRLEHVIINPGLEARMAADPNLRAKFLSGIPAGRLGRPDDIRGLAVFLASDASAWITGALIPMDGGNLAMNAGGSLGTTS